MLILLVRGESAALSELERLVWQCYPDSDILSFHDAEEALTFVEEEGVDVDLCMTDIKLRGMTGLGLVQKLHDWDRRTRTVLISDSSAYGIDAWRVRASDYLLEPVTLESIQHTVGNCTPFLSGYLPGKRNAYRVR